MKPRKKSAGKGKRRESPSGQNEVVLSDVVPGQQLERAAADITRKAGLSIIDGLKRLFGARLAGWIAKNEANAKAARMAIETDASIDRGRKIASERRRQELEEIQHEEHKALARRHLNRLLIEMARQEENFETIAARSLKQIEHDPAGDKSREIEDDWLFKFAHYAQDVSDSEIQELWARILASAAIEGRQRVSAAALQAMSLLDNRSANDLEKFFRVHVTFGCYPIPQDEPQAINLRTLQELGLIEKRTLDRFRYPKLDSFPEFDLYVDSMGFTQRGDEIVNAVFQQQTDKRLGDELEMKYLKNAISQISPRTIYPKINGKQVAYLIELTKRTGQPLPDIKADIPELKQLPDQLRRLMKWADEDYVISLAPNPNYRE
jgi:hypothetical protein